jgi:hypothetical protein
MEASESNEQTFAAAAFVAEQAKLSLALPLTGYRQLDAIRTKQKS